MIDASSGVATGYVQMGIGGLDVEHRVSEAKDPAEFLILQWLHKY